MAKRVKFPNHLVVKQEDDYHIIVGSPDEPSNIDAEDGERVGIYVLQQVKVYRINPRLEAK